MRSSEKRGDRHSCAPGCRTGGSIASLSVTDAWAELLPVMG
jgi:hypothetical protein